MKRCAIVFALLAGVALFGCKKPEPPPPPPAAPPEPSPEQIAAEIRPSIALLASVVQDSLGGTGDKGRGASFGFSDEMKEQVLNGLRQARAKHQATENGRQALATITHEIEGIISKARDMQKYRCVLGGIEAYEIMEPGSTKMNRLKERAKLYVNRPLVRVRGFFDDKETGEVYAFLEVTMMPSREVQQVKVRKGDEFYGMRLVDLVGNKKGVTIEYLAIPGDTRDVMGP